MSDELALASAQELRELYRSRLASPVEATRAVFERIGRLNPRLNAVVALDEEGALSAARASEARWGADAARGELDGVPLTVKDNIAVAGLPCTWGSPVFRDFVPERDELPVARLRDAGAVILGKTNVPEFTLQGYTDNTLFGPTRNPWDARLTPGGSSGGAVAAVAAGLAPLALGTDGGGSIRRPAAHTGLVGIKPTPGRVPRCDGLPAILLDLEQIGPIARTVADAVTLLRCISARDPRDPLSLFMPAFEVPGPPGDLSVLYVPRFGDHPVDPEIAESCAAAARAFAALGLRVEEGPAPFDADAVAAAWGIVGQAGLAWLMERRGGAEPAAATLRAMAETGRTLKAPALFDAIDTIAEFRRRLHGAVFARWSLILTPATAALPWPAEQSHPREIAGQPVGPRGHAVFTAFANAGGIPGIALPSAPSRRRLPIGVQLLGPAGSEGLLCSVAAAYEGAHPWAGRRPAVR